MLRNIRFWLVVGIVVVVVFGAGAVYYVTSTAAAEPADETAQVQTAPVRRGDITISAAGSGTVIPATEVALGFQTSGILKELLVRVGDRVAEGDVLARLDDTDSQMAVANAELQLNQAAMKTDPTSTQTGLSYNEISIEQARINLETAQTALDDLLNWQPDENEIAKAEANLAAAQAGYNAALGQESSKNYSNEAAKINLEQAQREMTAAQENYDAAWDQARDWETFWDEPICDPGEKEPCTGQTWAERIERDRESTANALTRAQDSLAIAQANYNAAVSGSASSSSATAKSNLVTAQQALEAAKTGPDDEQIDAARKTVRQAELALQQALLNQEADGINLAQAQLNLETAREGLARTELIAPMDGTVMSINAQVGEQVGASTFLTLADLDRPLLEVFIDETDLDKIGLDYPVNVVFDAMPDETFTGHVVQVDPQLSTVNGVTAVRAVVQLDPDSFAKPQTLPIGLNGSVDVIGGQALGALLVPVEALREISPGEYAVFVMADGEPQLRFVEVGLMDYTYVEILSGLSLGDVVTTGIVETQ